MSNEPKKVKHIEALLTQIENHEYLCESLVPWEEGVDVTNKNYPSAGDLDPAPRVANLAIEKMINS